MKLKYCIFVLSCLAFSQRHSLPGSLPHTEVLLGEKTKNTQFSQTRANSKIIHITRTIYWSRI